MKLIRGFQPISELRHGAVATIGNFDGVHKGHQALLAALRPRAKQLGLPLLVVIFEPQPAEYFLENAAPVRLSTLREKLKVLKSSGVDLVYCLKFNHDLSAMDATKFAQEILFTLLNIKHLLIGLDFRFGNDRIGNVKLLRTLASNFGCKIDIFADYEHDNERVSSTKIRKALQQSNLEQAAKNLGRPYNMCGRVVRGKGLGRQWGIPTANLNLQRKNLPLTGVYGVQVKRQNGSMHLGVANLGCRPTVDGLRSALEIHLFDFNESLYGEVLDVTFLYKIRDEIKFSSVDALIEQIHKDISMAKARQFAE